MDAALTTEQQLVFDTACTFASSAMSTQGMRDLESSECGFDLDVWRRMAELGWVDCYVSPVDADASGGMLETALIVEACGRAALPTPIFSTVVEAGWLLGRLGSPDQRRLWLEPAAAGKSVLTTAILESSGELLAPPFETTLDTRNARRVLNGKKMFVRDAGAAERIICLAKSGSAEDAMTWVVVAPSARGVSISRMPASGGEQLFEVRFDNVEIDSSSLLGDIDGAQSSLRRLILRGACLKAAELLGLGYKALELTLAYAKQRIQFDKPIGSFQAVHHHCADMHLNWQATYLLVYKAAAAFGRTEDPVRDVALAKAKASEAMPALLRLAHQIHGTMGYYRDYPLELYYHRSMAAQVAYGDAHFHRARLAEMLREDVSRFRGDDLHELPIHSL